MCDYFSLLDICELYTQSIVIMVSRELSEVQAETEAICAPLLSAGCAALSIQRRSE
jgi:hypothetical protein